MAFLSNFTWFLRNIFKELSFFSITRGRFWQNLCLIPCVVFDLWRHYALLAKSLFDTLIYDVISDIILLYFTNFTTSSPLWTTRLDFYEIFMRSKDVQHDQRKILAKHFFDTMSRFDLWRHLWRYFALFH